jgi:hypothetical protein
LNSVGVIVKIFAIFFVKNSNNSNVVCLYSVQKQSISIEIELCEPKKKRSLFEKFETLFQNIFAKLKVQIVLLFAFEIAILLSEGLKEKNDQ